MALAYRTEANEIWCSNGSCYWYVHSMVLLSDSAKNLPKMTDICSEKATYLRINFSLPKSGVRGFTDGANAAPGKDRTRSNIFSRAL